MASLLIAICLYCQYYAPKCTDGYILAKFGASKCSVISSINASSLGSTYEHPTSNTFFHFFLSFEICHEEWAYGTPKYKSKRCCTLGTWWARHNQIEVDFCKPSIKTDLSIRGHYQLLANPNHHKEWGYLLHWHIAFTSQIVTDNKIQPYSHAFHWSLSCKINQPWEYYVLW